MGREHVTHRRRIRGGFAVLFLGVGLSACATGVRSPLALPPEGGALAEDHVVEVTNRNWDGMQIYATQGTAVYRLGSVEGHSTRRFRLPVAFAGRAGGMRLAARVRGGPDLHYSEVINLSPGQTLGWTLESNLRLSFHWVR